MISLHRLLTLQKLSPLSSQFSRKFLSAAYPCTEAWNRRLESPLLSKINPRDLFLELDKKLSPSGKVSAVDVDLFAHTINEEDATEEFMDILHRFRMTAETSKTLESTHHAVIRFFLDNNHIDELLTILDDRLNYGIFPDHFSINLILNHLLKVPNHVAAVKVASLLMLQEDKENPLCNALALYSCGKLLEEGFDKWELPPEPVVDPKEEVVKIRVRYLRNPYFDDHFDLKDPKAITGKTMVFFTKNRDDTLGRSCLLLGYVLWGKHKMAAECVAKWRSVDGAVFKEVLEKVEGELKLQKEKFKEGEDLKDFEKLREEVKSLKSQEGSLVDKMAAEVKMAVEEHEQKMIQEQIETFKKWEEVRMAELHRQLDELDKQARLEKVKKMKEDMKQEERLLTFFDHEEEIELKIEDKLQRELEMYGPPSKKKIDEDDNYVPPEIKSRAARRGR
ncbi:GSCOCG00009625001-RA-CDS [Cotesia congregata]|uniref:Mitochondrial (Bos taurus) n=1 Tax=Cotesia congregata TaxID=51543 RepID=A0A8J2E6E1_COTCN|nr:GSCOCG00009625001-RA-CDS [Cotesia congregata]CAG5075129.1 Similar to MRPS27: 28S ribosomal protein S27 [Cotesia congregata]